MGVRIPRRLLGYKITIWPFTGTGPIGPIYGGSFYRRAHVVTGRPLNVSNGAEEITSDIAVYIDPDIAVPVRSKVEIEDSLYTVVVSETHKAPNLPTPDHIKLMLVPYTDAVLNPSATSYVSDIVTKNV